MIDMIDPKTQAMSVDVKFTYEAPVYEGDTDMYAVADEEQEFLQKELAAFLENYSQATGLKVTVLPKLI